MIYVDTNILIRLATNDVPAMVTKADQWLTGCGTRSVKVEEVVVEEATFVLAKYSKYLLTRDVIVEVLRTVLQRDEFIVDDAVFRALDIFCERPKLDFVDCLLAVKAGGKRNNILTFDTELATVLK